jgi:hypothetical protein
VSRNCRRIDGSDTLAGAGFAERGTRRLRSDDTLLLGESDETFGRVWLDLTGSGSALDWDEDVEELDNVLKGVALVARDGDMIIVDLAEVETVLDGVLVKDAGGGGLETDGEAVEVRLVDDLVAELGDSSSDNASETVDLLSDLAETFGTVVDGVHGGDVGKESLNGMQGQSRSP